MTFTGWQIIIGLCVTFSLGFVFGYLMACIMAMAGESDKEHEILREVDECLKEGL